MPLGTDEGNPRHGRNRGGLGEPLIWPCPACGEKNEGRRPEEGCVHCGSGVPKVQEAPAPAPVKAAKVEALGPTSTFRFEPKPAAPALKRILRLIEYEFDTPEALESTLQRSLVGRVNLGNLRITGCIVDDLSLTQEDRLRMAKMQPGVWLGQREQTQRSVASLLELGGFESRRASRASENPTGGGESGVAPHPGVFDREAYLREQYRGMQNIYAPPKEELQPMAPTFTVRASLAISAIATFPPYVQRTLQLALMVAMEQFADLDPEEFLTQAEIAQVLSWLEVALPPLPEEVDQPLEITDEEQQRREDLRATLGQAPQATSAPGIDELARQQYQDLQSRKGR